jgi:hypothetical protein
MSLLTTPHALEWLTTVWFVADPRPQLQRLQQDLEDSGATPEDAHKEVWEAPRNILLLDVADKWRNNTPVYSPLDVWQTLGINTRYSIWVAKHELPDLLTAGQAAYLLKFCRPRQLIADPRRVSARRLDHLLDPRSPEHPRGWTPMLVRRQPRGARVKSKVGATYGGWKLLRCLSDDESTANNRSVEYECSCTTCGARQTLDYRNLNKTHCKACKISKTQPKRKRLQEPLMAYVMADSSLIVATGNKAPDGAKAVFRIVYYNEKCDMRPLTAEGTLPQLDFPDLEEELEQAEELELAPELPEEEIGSEEASPEGPVAPPEDQLDAILPLGELPM